MRRAIDARALLEELRADPSLAAEFAAVLAPCVFGYAAHKTAPDAYTSRRGGPRPSGYAERDWQALARRIGVRRGRWFVVTKEQLEAHEHPRSPALAANDSETWSPEAALASVGLRGSR